VPFLRNSIVNENKLKAAIKYRFLLAEDASLVDYHRHIVPANESQKTHVGLRKP
jgi:hypothetical protein